MNPNLLLVLVCLGAGLLLRRTGRFPSQTPKALNAFVVWISLPALVLVQIPALLSSPFDGSVFVPLSMAWIHFALAFALFWILGRNLGWKRTQTGALILTAGLGNTSFVGFPLLESIYGPSALPIGILVDQPGSFLVLSTLGLLTASWMAPHSGKPVSAASIARNVLTFPPFVSLVTAIAWQAAGHGGAEFLKPLLERLASTLVPLALVAVGFQLSLSRDLLRRRWTAVGWGLGFKLLLAPAFFSFFYFALLGSDGLATRVTVLESAMAPMITAGVVAEEFGLDAEVAGLMVGVGIPLSLLTVQLWSLAPWLA